LFYNLVKTSIPKRLDDSERKRNSDFPLLRTFEFDKFPKLNTFDYTNKDWNDRKNENNDNENKLIEKNNLTKHSCNDLEGSHYDLLLKSLNKEWDLLSIGASHRLK